MLERLPQGLERLTLCCTFPPFENWPASLPAGLVEANFSAAMLRGFDFESLPRQLVFLVVLTCRSVFTEHLPLLPPTLREIHGDWCYEADMQEEGCEDAVYDPRFSTTFYEPTDLLPLIHLIPTGYSISFDELQAIIKRYEEERKLYAKHDVDPRSKKYA